MKIIFLRVTKAYLNSPTSSLNFSKTDDCSAVKQNFTSFTGKFCYSSSKITIIPTMFTGKHVKLLKIIALVFYNLCNTACILESETNKASSKTDIQ